MKTTRYQIIKVQIPSSGALVRFNAETDKLYDRVMGMHISLPSQEHHLGSTIELKISEDEIFPEGFETKLLTSDQSTSPNERFSTFDEDDYIQASGSLISGRFSDGGAQGLSYPYTAIMYLKLKKEIIVDDQG